MNTLQFSTIGHSAALEYAAKELCRAGWQHKENAKIILLPVPSLDATGRIKGGPSPDELPAGALIIGGNLKHSAFEKRKCIDLLQNNRYLSENAAITAHCALCIAMENLPVTLTGCKVLVVGWGRIGKCLARLLRLLGADVTIAARADADRALAGAFGYRTMDIREEEPALSEFRVIYNTAPAMVLTKKKLSVCRDDCLKIDLASVPGMEGNDIIWAKGLPNLDAPESSGKLIAQIVNEELAP